MGFSFGEMVVIAIVALIVIGPKDLPKLLRTAGRMIGTIKRTVAEVRRETGLDEVLRGDFQDLERLADHIERMEAPARDEPEQLALPNLDDGRERREREYPRIGADAHDLLPEDAPVYGDLPAFGGDAPKLPLAPPEGVVAAHATSSVLSADPSRDPSRDQDARSSSPRPSPEPSPEPSLEEEEVPA